jgi:hypothetical protein
MGRGNKSTPGKADPIEGRKKILIKGIIFVSFFGISALLLQVS